MSPRRPAALALSAAVCCATGACTDPAPAEGPGAISGVTRIEYPLITAYDFDVLFVIDNSPGMASQRAKLLESYRRFIEVLESNQGGLYNVHIGVVTTDVGTRGPLDPDPGPSIGTGDGACTSDGDRGELRRAVGIDGNFLSDIARPDGTRERNYTGSLADAFLRIADVGTSGCTYARPLEAMRRALSGNPANAGFLRPDAGLVVVLLTNDDDCSFGSASFTGGVLDRSRCETGAGSLVAVEEYFAFLRTLKLGQRQIIPLGGFAPPGEPACADARPAPRLGALADGFLRGSDIVSICEQDLGEVLVPGTWALRHLVGPPCFLEPLLDIDPIADGVQAECAGWYTYQDRGELFERLLPECRGDAPGPCWRLDQGPNPFSCDGGVVELRDVTGLDAAARGRAFIECVSR